MKTLYIFCEGKTEQQFCRQVIAPHLFTFEFMYVPTVKVAFSRKKGVVHRGGLTKYAPVKKDIQNELKRQKAKDVYFTSMLDLYKLPKDFPDKDRLTRNPSNPTPYVQALESAFERDIGDSRFVAYIQLHEYETLLFAEPEAFELSFPNSPKVIDAITRIAGQFPSIEHIDDGENTAPSKRIINLLPQYERQKSTAGPDIAEYIGLDTLREKCPHFDNWLKKIESL